MKDEPMKNLYIPDCLLLKLSESWSALFKEILVLPLRGVETIFLMEEYNALIKKEGEDVSIKTLAGIWKPFLKEKMKCGIKEADILAMLKICKLILLDAFQAKTKLISMITSKEVERESFYVTNSSVHELLLGARSKYDFYSVKELIKLANGVNADLDQFLGSIIEKTQFGNWSVEPTDTSGSWRISREVTNDDDEGDED